MEIKRRSIRNGSQVFCIALEDLWLQELDRICDKGQARDWLLIWLEEADERGINRQALIRYKIHELALEDAREQAQVQDRVQDLLRRIDNMRARRMPWARIASSLSDCGLIPGWSSEDVRKFYYKYKGAAA